MLPEGYTGVHMIRLIIWVVIALLALSFFGVSLQALVENPTNQNNMAYLGDQLEAGWDYLVAWFEVLLSPFTGWMN